jgi:O-antigen/teichoic acid export membrane protein
MPRVVPTSPDSRLNPINPPRPLVSILRNSAANLARIGVSWLVALFLPPLLVRVLDKPTYGTWMLILQIGAYVNFLDGGLQNAIARFVGRAQAMKDSRYMSRMLSSAALLLVLIAGITTCVTLLLFWRLDAWFPNIPADIEASSRQALLAIGISLAFGLPFSTYAGAFFGLQMNHVNAIAGTLGRLAGAAGAAWAAFHHQGLVVMALWIAAGNGVQAILLGIAWNRRAALRRIPLTDVHRDSTREFMHFCYAMFATQFGAFLITGLDMPVVARFDFHATAYYAVAAMAGNLLAVPQSAIVSTFIPIASGISVTGSPANLGAVVIKSSRYANCLLCLMALPLAFAMHLFLLYWVGADYASHALVFAEILLLAQFVRVTLMPYASIGFAAGQQHRMLWSPLVEGIANLACSMLGAYLWGAIGVVIGTLIGAVAGVLIHFTVSMPRTGAMLFSRRRLLFRSIVTPIACCAPGAGLLLVLLKQGASPAYEIALIGIAELSSMLLFWVFVLATDERRAVLSSAHRLAQRRGNRSTTSRPGREA